ncbi:MAG: hypothetical protein JNJ81_15110 [Candidatus Accumulibacter sp.]|nr:hypothetical protein [Accumulibacter sp.]
MTSLLRSPAISLMRRRCWMLALLPLLIALIFLFAASDPAPMVSRDETISPTSIAEARRLLVSNDPRRLRRGDERTVVIPSGLIDTAINHFASRSLGGRGTFVLSDDTAEIQLTIRAPGIPGPRYCNLRAVFQEAEGEPHIVAASMGSLPIPSALAEWLIASAISIAGFSEEWKIARQAIRRLAFEPARDSVELTYVWEPHLLDRARSMAFTPQDLVHMHAAQKALAGLLDHYAARARVPLSQILAPLLAPASDQTLSANRAALLVLASYLAEKNLAMLLPEAKGWPRARRVKLTLLGREDSAQHFGISAALAVWAGEPAANAIGVYKEIDDSRGGSGFSFADLAADRAGTRFGELVVDDYPRLYKVLRGSVTDADLLPSLAGLPEYLSEAEFKRRFSDLNVYAQQTDEIERRLAMLPLYR